MQDAPLQNSKHSHLMGIGGIGVSGLARLLLARGQRVSGCDSAQSATTQDLEKRGVQVFIGHSSAHITPDVGELVLSTGIRREHPEVRSALERGIPVRYRIEVLAELMAGVSSVGVTGTHGKTTVSSMGAVALLGGGLDPTAFVGSTLPEFGGLGVRLGAGPFIAEIDESDPLFERVKPGIAVLTNLEADHIGRPGDKRPNFAWDSLEALSHATKRYLEGAHTVLYCADWPGLEDLVRSSGHAVRSHGSDLSTLDDAFSYGLEPGAFYGASQLEFSEFGSSFEFTRAGQALGEVVLNVPGRHNAQNALAALAVNDLLGGDFAGAARALERFRGAARRFDLRGTVRGALVVDDYAHHPTEVAATLEAARRTGRRVRVVFQPHRYLRTSEFWEGFADALEAADDVMVLDIYAAGETPIEGVRAENIATRMQGRGHPSVHFLGSFERTLEHLDRTLEPHDLVLTMGAGDVTALGPRILALGALEGAERQRPEGEVAR